VYGLHRARRPHPRTGAVDEKLMEIILFIGAQADIVE